jgi:ADP-ribosylglycohydrolase
MLGAITGDTVGSIYEFHNTKDYDFTLFNSESSYTDDSVMTMAVAYWLLTDPEHTYQKLEDAMLMFAQKCPCPMGGYGGGFYTWLFRPKGRYSYDSKYGMVPYESRTGRHPYGSWGNGSAMRVSAVGWFFDTLEETERVAAVSAAITHDHPEGIKGAQATAAAIFLARSGKSKEEIRDYVERTYGYDLHKSWEYWHPVYKWESSCQGTVPQAIIAFLDSTGFEDAIRKAVSLGGDSDTLACITGGIAEAYYREVPKMMADRVRKGFPPLFEEILAAVREKTAYGSVCRIGEGTGIPESASGRKT